LAEKSENFSNDELGRDSGSDAMAWVTATLYDVVWDTMFQELRAVQAQDPHFWSTVTEIAVLGGIIVNRSDKGEEATEALEDYFQPLMFQILNVEGSDDILSKTFSDANDP
jgi:hypothetical protein